MREDFAPNWPSSSRMALRGPDGMCRLDEASFHNFVGLTSLDGRTGDACRDVVALIRDSLEPVLLEADSLVAFRTGDLDTPCNAPEVGTLLKSLRKPKGESFAEDLCGKGGASISPELDLVKASFG